MSNSWGHTDPFGRSTSKEEFELDFTSMIDIVFLLMIFFMVQSALSSQTEVDLPPAQQAAAVDPSNASVVTILENDVAGSEARYILGNLGSPSGSIDDVRHYIEDGLRQVNPRALVIVKAERHVPHRVVLEVARVVEQVKGAELSIAVQEGK